jgi:hypothetical protein
MAVYACNLAAVTEDMSCGDQMIFAQNFARHLAISVPGLIGCVQDSRVPDARSGP